MTIPLASRNTLLLLFNRPMPSARLAKLASLLFLLSRPHSHKPLVGFFFFTQCLDLRKGGNSIRIIFRVKPAILVTESSLTSARHDVLVQEDRNVHRRATVPARSSMLSGTGPDVSLRVGVPFLVRWSSGIDCGRYSPTGRLGRLASVRGPRRYLRASGSDTWAPSPSLFPMIHRMSRRGSPWGLDLDSASPLHAGYRRRHGAVLCWGIRQ